MSEGTRREVHSRTCHRLWTTSQGLLIATNPMTSKEWYSYSSNSTQVKRSCKCLKLITGKAKTMATQRECSTHSSRSALPVRTPPQTSKTVPQSNKTSLSGFNRRLRSSLKSGQQPVSRTRVRPEPVSKRKSTFYRAAALPRWLLWLSSCTTLAKLSKALSLVLKGEKSS